MKKLWLQFVAWLKALGLSIKTWWMSLGGKIKIGINKLYKEPWFNLISVFIAGFAAFSGWPGMVWMFIYFTGWIFFSDKKIIPNEKT